MRRVIIRCWLLFLCTGWVFSLSDARAAVRSPTSPEVILIMSIDPPSGVDPHSPFPRWLQNSVAEMMSAAFYRMEERFREHYDQRRYSLRVIRHGDQAQLWDALHSPTAIGVIWLSHSDFHGRSEGFGFVNPIVDADGFDVSNVIQSFSQNLRFFAVVGCSSSGIIGEQFIRHHLRRRFPNLAVYSFWRTTDAVEGLEEVLDWSDGVLQSQLPVNHPMTRQMPSILLTITRSVVHPEVPGVIFPAIRVETRNGRVLGVFPRLFRGDRQTISVPLIGHLGGFTDSSQLHLVFTAGTNGRLTHEQIQLGAFSISSDNAPGAWRVVSNRNGVPIGVTQHLYNYRGELPRCLDRFQGCGQPNFTLQFARHGRR